MAERQNPFQTQKTNQHNKTLVIKSWNDPPTPEFNLKSKNIAEFNLRQPKFKTISGIKHLKISPLILKKTIAHLEKITLQTPLRTITTRPRPQSQAIDTLIAGEGWDDQTSNKN